MPTPQKMVEFLLRYNEDGEYDTYKDLTPEMYENEVYIENITHDYKTEIEYQKKQKAEKKGKKKEKKEKTPIELPSREVMVQQLIDYAKKRKMSFPGGAEQHFSSMKIRELKRVYKEGMKIVKTRQLRKKLANPSTDLTYRQFVQKEFLNRTTETPQEMIRAIAAKWRERKGKKEEAFASLAELGKKALKKSNEPYEKCMSKCMEKCTKKKS